MTSQKDAQEHSSLESLLSNWIARLPSAATSDCGKAKARRTASRTVANLSSAERENFKQNGLARAREFTWDRAIQKTMQVISRLI